MNELHSRGICTMATTHYSELKVFALTTPGVENGCCEFSVETLRPTYRLLIGVPGKSNAFAISGKLGLPEHIIEDARSRISEQDESFEDLLSDLEHSRITIEKEQEELARYKAEAASLKAQLEKKQERLDSAKERILAEANEKAHTILREAKEYADETIKNFNKYGKAAGVSISDMERERTRLREKMNAAEKNMAKKTPAKVKKAVDPKALRVGDSVKVLSLNLKGTVSTLPDAKGNLFVQMGILRSQVNLRDIEPIDEPVITASNFNRTGSGKIKMAKSSSVGIELNLLGKTVRRGDCPSWISIWTTPTLPTFPPCGSFTEKAPVPSGKPYTTISAAARSWMSTIWASSARETQALPS